MIICQGVPIMHHFERFTVDLDEKLGDSLLECPVSAGISWFFLNFAYLAKNSPEIKKESC